jgi:replicative DNA helicase
MSFEQVIFGNLVLREEYGRKVIPFLKQEYFENGSDRIIFELINDYVQKYNNFPTQEALGIELSNKEHVDQNLFTSASESISQLDFEPDTSIDWLVDQTEKFCQEKAIYNGIRQSIQIMDGSSEKTLSKGSIPHILSDALAVSFDSNIGHNWMDDSDSRYDFYHRKEVRVPFDLSYLNKITDDGLPNKTLNVILAGTGVGKSLFMCHCAAANLMAGKNVLYITMEMAEERIAERIDANLLDTPIKELSMMPKETYQRKIGRIKSKTMGKIIIKEYPTSSAGSSNFRYLLNELKLKKNFKPDIIYIDYLNICSSSRIKYTANINSYTYVKAIAEELRGLAVEFNVPIVTATQTTRGGFNNSDVGLEDTSESFGLPATADLMIALISTEELVAMNQIMVKQLKNRYNDISLHKRFVIGVDKSKMKLYDVEDVAQSDIVDDRPLMDKTSFGTRDNDEFYSKPKFNKNNFKDFK